MPLYRLSNVEVTQILFALNFYCSEISDAPINECQDLVDIIKDANLQEREIKQINKIQHKLYKKIKE